MRHRYRHRQLAVATRCSTIARRSRTRCGWCRARWRGCRRVSSNFRVNTCRVRSPDCSTPCTWFAQAHALSALRSHSLLFSFLLFYSLRVDLLVGERGFASRHRRWPVAALEARVGFGAFARSAGARHRRRRPRRPVHHCVRASRRQVHSLIHRTKRTARRQHLCGARIDCQCERQQRVALHSDSWHWHWHRQLRREPLATGGARQSGRVYEESRVASAGGRVLSGTSGGGVAAAHMAAARAAAIALRDAHGAHNAQSVRYSRESASRDAPRRRLRATRSGL